jgi:hypothetical protein
MLHLVLAPPSPPPVIPSSHPLLRRSSNSLIHTSSLPYCHRKGVGTEGEGRVVCMAVGMQANPLPSSAHNRALPAHQPEALASRSPEPQPAGKGRCQVRHRSSDPKAAPAVIWQSQPTPEQQRNVLPQSHPPCPASPYPPLHCSGPACLPQA